MNETRLRIMPPDTSGLAQEVKLIENWHTEIITKVKIKAKDEKEAHRKLRALEVSLVEPIEGVQLGVSTAFSLNPVCPVCDETVATAVPYPKTCYYCGTKLKEQTSRPIDVSPKKDVSTKPNIIKQLCSQGYTLEQIGQAFGVSRQRIHQLLLKEKAGT